MALNAHKPIWHSPSLQQDESIVKCFPAKYKNPPRPTKIQTSVLLLKMHPKPVSALLCVSQEHRFFFISSWMFWLLCPRVITIFLTSFQHCLTVHLFLFHFVLLVYLITAYISNFSSMMYLCVSNYPSFFTFKFCKVKMHVCFSHYYNMLIKTPSLINIY